MGKKLQKVTFKPNPEQIKFVAIYLDYNQKKTKEELAEEIGVTRMTLWRWFQNDEFVEWINSKKDELLKNSLIARYRTALRKAEAGDFNFSKLLFEMQGEYVQRSETKVTKVYDGYENMTNEEIIEEFKRDLDRFTRNKPGRVDTKVNQAKKD